MRFNVSDTPTKSKLCVSWGEDLVLNIVNVKIFSYKAFVFFVNDIAPLSWEYFYPIIST